MTSVGHEVDMGGRGPTATSGGHEVDMGGRGPTATSGGHEVDKWGGEGAQLPRQVDMRWTEGGKGPNCHIRWT